MSLVEEWTIIGSVATAIAALLSAVSVLVAVFALRTASKQLDQARSEARLTLYLTTSGLLFDYYNQKISSLKNAVAQGRNVEENQRQIDALTARHNELRDAFERQYEGLRADMYENP